MQTFLPYCQKARDDPNDCFTNCARSLDNSRLGNQGYRECLTLINGGRANHPAYKMWCYDRQGNKLDKPNHHLHLYAEMILLEWIDRGFETTVEFPIDQDLLNQQGLPWWFYCDDQCSKVEQSHRSNLIRKYPEHYQPLWPTTPNDLEYHWPGDTR